MTSSGAAPFQQVLEAETAAVAAGADLSTVLGEAHEAGTVTKVVYVPVAAITGANTNSRTLSLVNKKQDGTGTTVVATLALVSGANMAAADENAVTLSGTPANLVVASGDVLEWTSVHVGTGLADPGGLVHVEIARS